MIRIAFITTLLLLPLTSEAEELVYEIIKVNNKMKRALIKKDGDRPLQKGSQLLLRNDTQRCFVDVLKSQENKSVVSTQSCDFEVGLSDIVTDEYFDSEADFLKAKSTRVLGNRGSEAIKPYFIMDLDVQSELIKNKTANTNYISVLLGSKLYLSKKEDVVLSGYLGRSYWKWDSGSSVNIGNPRRYKGHVNDKGFGIQLVPLLFSSLQFRPLGVYKESYTSEYLKTLNESSKSEEQKYREYGLGVQYDLDSSLEKISFVQLYFVKTKNRVYQPTRRPGDFLITNGQAVHLIFNSGGSLSRTKYIWRGHLLYEKRKNIKDYWGLTISARADDLGASLSYFNEGYSQVVLGVQFYFEKGISF